MAVSTAVGEGPTPPPRQDLQDWEATAALLTMGPEGVSLLSNL